MKFSENWLREWANPDVDTEQLVADLTMAGLEVDDHGPVAGAFSDVVVARITSAEQHPNADKLRLCQVDDGSGDSIQIVCGAPNARAGLIAPLARVGAVLPGDFKIKPAKLRGVESFGMLCSGKELGLSDDADGLLELPANADIGARLRDFLDLDDQFVEIDLTPNRADCLGMRGIARDVAAIYDCEYKDLEIEVVGAVFDDESISVELLDAEDCPRYVGRTIRNIDQHALTPLWMQERLRRCGLRPISPVVDVTNYVLLELGQPMHAFDRDCLQGPIGVRRARAGESLRLLDDREVDVDEQFLLITDAGRPVALAGLMGGLDTSVTDQTSNLFLESAYFKPSTIIGRARKLGMHTDASHRFERGVDPQLQRQAMERATALLLDIVGGEAGPIVEASEATHLPVCEPVHLRAERLDRLLGDHIDASSVERIFAGLGMSVESTDDGWRVTAPSSRFDIAEEVDLIEEVGRIHGYDRLPEHPPAGAIPPASLPEDRIEMARLRSVLVERGYSEAVNYAFVAPDQQDAMQVDQQSLPLANPLSADMSVMRTSLLPGLLSTLIYNQHRQQQQIRLFESGVCFPIESGHVREQGRLAGIQIGAVLPEQWASKTRNSDFFDLKGDLEALLALTGNLGSFRFERSRREYLHPGQSADIYRAETVLGWIGALHPDWVARAGAKGTIFAFELSLDVLLPCSVPIFHQLSRFPSIRRDLAIVVNESVSWLDIRQLVEEISGNLLTELVVFDEYMGDGIEQGYKSLAIGMILRDTNKTLTDQQVDTVVDSVVTHLGEKFDAVLRG
jgi:phenylalanyl-tRNA synthetase beta chain